MAIKEKLSAQRKHIEDLDKHMYVDTHYSPHRAMTDIYTATM
jgi:hypothetical protein